MLENKEITTINVQKIMEDVIKKSIDSIKQDRLFSLVLIWILCLITLLFYKIWGISIPSMFFSILTLFVMALCSDSFDPWYVKNTVPGRLSRLIYNWETTTDLDDIKEHINIVRKWTDWIKDIWLLSDDIQKKISTSIDAINKYLDISIELYSTEPKNLTGLQKNHPEVMKKLFEAILTKLVANGIWGMVYKNSKNKTLKGNILSILTELSLKEEYIESKEYMNKIKEIVETA